jgi:hypothetical protein
VRVLRSKRAFEALYIAALCAGLTGAFAVGSLLLGGQVAARQKAANESHLRWAPPDVDAPIPSLSLEPPCPLSTVIEQAGKRSIELIANLQNFGAQENIEYERLDQFGVAQDSQGIFDYVAAFDRRGGGLSVQESRAPIKVGGRFPTTDEDSGLAALALIFYPGLQDDYEFACEGADQWNGQSAWVIHFQQRKDRPARTMGFRTPNQAFPARLKGRAWIATDSFQVLHLETNLMQGILLMKLRTSATEIDYAAVQFHSQNVQLWLPQSAAVFSDFGDSRVVVQHTFTDFHLFSIQMQQKDDKPKGP